MRMRMKMRHLVALIVLVCATLLSSHPALAQWTSGGPYGGNVRALAIDPTTPATLYAGTDGGVFKSADSGGTWAATNTGLTNLYVNALAINPTMPSTLYAGTGGGVFKSTNSGGTWAAADTGLTNLSVYALAINPTTPATLYAGTGGGVFKSTDSGSTWAYTGPANYSFIALAINPTTPSTLYAVESYFGVVKSTDSGSTWAAANTGLPTPSAGAIAISPTTPTTLYAATSSGVFKSTDSGATWAAAHTGLTGWGLHALTINPTTPATLYAATEGGVFKSTDSGGSWAAANIGLTALSVYALAIHPTTPATLYAGTAGGVFKSTDSGASWAAANTGLTAVSVNALAISPTTPATLYAGTYNGVFKSADSGGTWSAVNTGLAGPSLYVYALAIHPTTPATLYAGTYNGVFKSTDAGATWVLSNAGRGFLTARALAIDPTTTTTLYAGVDLQVSKSTDSGATWVDTSLHAGQIFSLAINPTTPATLYAGTDVNGVFKSTDSAGTWAAANMGLPGPSVWLSALAINPTTPATLYAGVERGPWAFGVFKSTDAGGTWNVVNTGLTDLFVCAFAINPTAPATLYAGTEYGGIFKSTDSAGTWAAASTGLPSLSVNALALDPTGTTLYAGLANGSVWQFTPSVVLFPLSPTPVSPGGPAEGQTIPTLTPTLQWTAGDGATSYAITISARPYGSNSVVYSNASVVGASLALPSGVLVNGGRYRWEMTAINSAGASVVSSSLYFQVLLSGILPVPTPPVALSPGSGLGSGPALDTLTPTFRWTSSTGASTYGLRISRSPFGPSDVVFSKLVVAGTSFTLPGPVLAIGTQYRWNVTAINSGGESAASNSMYFALRDSASVPPAAPTGLTAMWVSGHASFGWADMSTNESGFKIERSDASGPYGQIGSTNQNTNSYTDTAASTSVDHCYRVRATNGTGDSVYSNESCIARQGTATASQHLQFSSAAYTVGGAAVTITRTGGSSGTVTVTVLVSQGTAYLGWDYSTFGPVAVTFAPGETSKTVTPLQSVGFQHVEDRTVNLALTGPTGDATLGSPSSAVLTIQGTPTPGTILLQDPVCIQGPVRNCNGGGLLPTSGFPDRTKLAQLVSVHGAVADGITLLVLSVTSSTPVTFSLSRPSPQFGTLMQLDGSGSASSITVTPVGSTAFALYQVPIDLTEEILLGVSARNALGNVIANGTIDLRHPPVVFVHGLWSDSSAFNTWDWRLWSMGYSVAQADYRYPNSADSFNPFIESVPINAVVLAVKEALNMSRGRSIAASQVDVVAHSMGGLVARARENDKGPRVKFNRIENRNFGEFHKLITIGTPHQGTLLANWFTKDESLSVRAAFDKVKKPMGVGVYDMQTTSGTLSLLGSTAVPTHAIVGKKPAGQTDTELNLNKILRDLGNFGVTIDSILASNREDDILVPIVSQRGWLTEGTTATTVPDVIHFALWAESDNGITETTAPEIFALVLQELTASTTSAAFGSIPVFSPTGQEQANVPRLGLVFAPAALGFAPAAAEIVTVSPTAGTVVRPGEVIQVVFSVPVGTGSTSAMISIGGQLVQVTGSNGSFSTTYQLPPDETGKITISATTLDLGAGNLSGETYVVALPSTPPAALVPSPGSVDFAVPGLTTKLTVIGTYGDTATADLTSSATGTTYSTLSGTNSVITVSAEGVVQAVANGQDTIIIQNGGQTASVTATVNITNQRPTLAALVDTTVVAGQTLDIPLTASDPDGNNLQLSGTSLPSFVTLVDNHNGTGVLSVHPSATDVGTYPIFISVVDDGNPALGMSRSLQLTVGTVPTIITTQPSNQTVTAGANAAFMVAASGAPMPTLQWQVSTNSGSSWSDLANNNLYSGVTTGTLSITGATIALNGYQYRCVATNSSGSTNSSAAMLTVNATSGDLNGDGVVTMADAIIALQVMAGMKPSGLRSDYTTSGVDVNVDAKVGIPELLYILQKAAGAR